MLKLIHTGFKIQLSVGTFCFSHTEIEQIENMIKEMKNKINVFIDRQIDYNTILLGYINNAYSLSIYNKMKLFGDFTLDNSDKYHMEINKFYENEISIYSKINVENFDKFKN